MSTPFSFGKIRIGVSAEEEAPPAASEETPFRIAVLGDFSGRASRGVREAGLASRRPIPIDRDNFDQVLARLGVTLQLPGGNGARMAIRFQELDDFRPERLIGQVQVFEKLREIRRKLGNSASFAAAAAEVRGWSQAPPPPPPPPPSEGGASGATPLYEEGTSAAGANLLDAILGETAVRSESARQDAAGPDWNSFLHKVVASYVVPKEDPRQAELLAQVDEATSGLMRALLHHPDFQALESTWRGLYFLIRRLDTDAALKLFLIDVSRDELAADLAASADLADTGTYRLLVEQTVGTPGAQPWAVLAGNYTFGPLRSDAELLARIAAIARRAGAPLLAAGGAPLLGCDSLGTHPDPDDWQLPMEPRAQEAWEALRRLPEATFLGLAWPRFLLRHPYGKDTDPIEGFAFEELPEGGRHEAYLWGNPAFACVYLLAEAFSRQGWGLHPGSIDTIEGLPLHAYSSDGDAVMQPCAEAVLGSRAIEKIGAKGIMPLLSVQGRDSVCLGGFRSLAVSGAALAGRWRS